MTWDLRNHLSSGVKYQERTPKMVTAPKIAGACARYQSNSTSQARAKWPALTKLKESDFTGKKKGEIMTWGGQKCEYMA
jgi:hypothetical protein